MEKYQGKLNYITAFIIPFVPMFYLYSKNFEYIAVSHVALLAILLGIFSLFVFFIVAKLSKSSFTGVVCCIAIWIVFFSYGGLYNSSGLYHRSLLLICAVIVAGITLFAFLLDRKKGLKAICSFFTIVVAVMLVWNAITAFTAIPKPDSSQVPYKVDFSIDETLPTPNIYWIHADGMLGFEAVEKYYGDSQEEFAMALEERGFVINRYAKYEAAHTTRTAIPVLMSPDAYDSYLFDLLLIKREEAAAKGNFVDRSFPTADIQRMLEVRRNLEIIKAFEQRGYFTAALGGRFTIPPITDYYADFSRRDELPVLSTEQLNNDEIARWITIYDQALELVTLMNETSMVSPVPDAVKNRMIDVLLSGSEGAEWKAFDSPVDPAEYIPSTNIRSKETAPLLATDEIMRLPSPRFAFVCVYTTHFRFEIDEYGISHEYNRDYAYNYYPQHCFATKYLINYTDFILERDPEAVIIIQGDHGLHGMSANNIMGDLSISDEEDVYDLWNCVMSAVRVPDEYGKLEEPLNPVNISRYLVNSFVGENYEYRLPEDSQGLY